MSLKHVLLILRSRWKLLLLTLFLTVGVTTIVSVFLPKKYTAATDIIIDLRSPDPIAGVALPYVSTSAYIATQVDIINSDRVARKVASSLKLDQEPAMREAWAEAGQTDDLMGWIVETLQKGLAVKPSRESNVISIFFTSTKPEFAAVLANAFARAYIDTTIELRSVPAKESNIWFQEQAKQARQVLEIAQERYSNYQKENGIVSADLRLDTELNKLNELSTQLSMVQGQYADAASKQKSIDSIESMPEVLQNSLIQNLKSELAKLEALLEESAKRLGEKHPQYLQQQAQIQSVRARLGAETRRIVESISTSSEVAKGKEAELLAAIEIQKKKILDLRSQRDRLAIYQQEVDAAQRAYDAMTARVTQSLLESQTTLTNVAVLTTAEAPHKASSPKIMLNIMLALILAIALGFVCVFILEFSNQKVRTVEDIKSVTQVPIIVELAEKPIVAIARRGKSGVGAATPKSKGSIKIADLAVPKHANSK